MTMTSLPRCPHLPLLGERGDLAVQCTKEQYTASQDENAREGFENASPQPIHAVLEHQYHIAHPEPLIRPTTLLTARPPKSSPSRVLELPLSIILKILRYILIPDPSRLQIFPLTPKEIQISNNNIIHDLPVLRTCRRLRHTGKQVFFAQNTFTTSSPSTSLELHRGIRNLSRELRCLITNISLQINWADELWVQFPLLAAALPLLVRLRRLEVFFVVRKVIRGGDGASNVEEEEEGREAKRRESRGVKRESAMAQLMMKAEKKMFSDWVLDDLKALEVFRLVGFADEEFARKMELIVNKRGACKLGGGPN